MTVEKASGYDYSRMERIPFDPKMLDDLPPQGWAED